MSSAITSNSFVQGFPARAGEWFQRKRAEVRAKAVSDAIGKQIERDEVAFARYNRAVKVLLLGQNGSG